MNFLTKNWIEKHEEAKKSESLTDVLTTKEVERLYKLPANTVLQDIRRGIVESQHFRQSGRTWLITRAECNRLYSNYVKQIRKRKQRA